MKALHISPSFYPASGYGGTINSGFGLCNALSRIPDLELRVITTDSDDPSGNRIVVNDFPYRSPAGYDIYYCRRSVGADISLGMFLQLWSMIKWADVVHLTAVYSPPTIPTLLLCKVLRKPVVWSPRGALQRWDASTRTGIKSVWERICQGLCDFDRVILHVTSEEEILESS